MSSAFAGDMTITTKDGMVYNHVSVITKTSSSVTIKCDDGTVTIDANNLSDEEKTKMRMRVPRIAPRQTTQTANGAKALEVIEFTVLKVVNNGLLAAKFQYPDKKETVFIEGVPDKDWANNDRGMIKTYQDGVYSYTLATGARATVKKYKFVEFTPDQPHEFKH